MEAAGVGIAVLVIILALCVYIGILGLAIVDYVMQSYGLYKLASRRGLENPWLAWIPIAQSWIVGGLAEGYDAFRRKRHPWKMILLILQIVSVGSSFVMQIVSRTVSSFAVALEGVSAAVTGDAGNNTPVFLIIAAIVAMLIICVLSVVAVAGTFCQTLCIFKIFESTVPEKALKYMILYLLVPLAGGICLLKCKDKGYPYPVVTPVMQQEPIQENAVCDLQEDTDVVDEEPCVLAEEQDSDKEETI